MMGEDRQLSPGVLSGLDIHMPSTAKAPSCQALGGPRARAGWLEPLGRFWGKKSLWIRCDKHRAWCTVTSLDRKHMSRWMNTTPSPGRPGCTCSCVDGKPHLSGPELSHTFRETLEICTSFSWEGETGFRMSGTCAFCISPFLLDV